LHSNNIEILTLLWNQFSGGVCEERHMPGDPHQCRLNAARCLALARRSRRPEPQEAFRAMALTWKQLAAETEADDALLRVISEMQFGEPFEVLPMALGLLPRAA
jgi:hypothetical protein